jgi:hypothetical protein
MQRGMLWVGVVMPVTFFLGVIVLKEPRMPDRTQKTAQMAELRGALYEDYEPDAQELWAAHEAQPPITPPARYNAYLNSTKKLANRHRKLKKNENKYTHKKDTKHVKQPGTTH